MQQQCQYKRIILFASYPDAYQCRTERKSGRCLERFPHFVVENALNFVSYFVVMLWLLWTVFRFLHQGEMFLSKYLPANAMIMRIPTLYWIFFVYNIRKRSLCVVLQWKLETGANSIENTRNWNIHGVYWEITLYKARMWYIKLIYFVYIRNIANKCSFIKLLIKKSRFKLVISIQTQFIWALSVHESHSTSTSIQFNRH